MWDKRKLLLASIIFMALCCRVTVEETKLLDMAPDAVDDLYKGCREAALDKFVHSGLLKQELEQNEDFKKAWTSENRCTKQIPGGTSEHRSALSAYSNDNQVFKKIFDSAVKTKGGNLSIYEEQFKFKALHFLLMDSITLMKPTKCKTMFAIRDELPAKKNSTVRFGQFNVFHSSFDELQGLEDLADMYVLNVTSCFFVDCSVDHTTLISPAESFTVEEITEKIDRNDDTYTEVILKHANLDSRHNCYSFSRSSAAASTQWLVLVLVSFSSLFFIC